MTFKFKAGLNTSALQGEFKSGIKTVKYVRESQTSQVILNGDSDRLVGSNLKRLHLSSLSNRIRERFN